MEDDLKILNVEQLSSRETPATQFANTGYLLHKKDKHTNDSAKVCKQDTIFSSKKENYGGGMSKNLKINENLARTGRHLVGTKHF